MNFGFLLQSNRVLDQFCLQELDDSLIVLIIVCTDLRILGQREPWQCLTYSVLLMNSTASLPTNMATQPSPSGYPAPDLDCLTPELSLWLMAKPCASYLESFPAKRDILTIFFLLPLAQKSWEFWKKTIRILLWFLCYVKKANFCVFVPYQK